MSDNRNSASGNLAKIVTGVVLGVAVVLVLVVMAYRSWRDEPAKPVSSTVAHGTPPAVVSVPPTSPSAGPEPEPATLPATHMAVTAPATLPATVESRIVLPPPGETGVFAIESLKNPDNTVAREAAGNADSLLMQIQMYSFVSNRNLVVSPDVVGPAVAIPKDGAMAGKLDAILRSAGLVVIERGNYLYIGTRERLKNARFPSMAGGAVATKASPGGNIDFTCSELNIALGMRLLSLQTKKKIIVSPKAATNVTMMLHNVEFQEAFDAMLTFSGLEVVEKEEGLYACTPEEIKSGVLPAEPAAEGGPDQNRP